MKGLLLKDLYCTIGYLKVFLIIDVAFTLLAAFGSGNLFLLLYPCILAGMVAMTLISYDEKEKWNTYAATLPYSKTQIVSSKYITSLILGIGTDLLIVLSQSISMIIKGTFEISAVLVLFVTFVPLTILSPSLLLPFIFKFGVDKGRIVYYLVLGVFCAVIGMTESMQGKEIALKSGFEVLIFLVSIIMFAVSWLLSIGFYKNKEL